MKIKTRKQQLDEGGYSALKHLWFFEEQQGDTSVVDIIGGVTVATDVAGIGGDLPTRSVDIPTDTIPSPGTLTQFGNNSFMIVQALGCALGGLFIGDSSATTPRISMQSILEMSINDGTNNYLGGALTNQSSPSAGVMLVDRKTNLLTGYEGNTTAKRTTDITSLGTLNQDNKMSLNSFNAAVNANGIGIFIFSGDVPSNAVSVGMDMANAWVRGQRIIDERCKDWA